MISPVVGWWSELPALIVAFYRVGVYRSTAIAGPNPAFEM